MLLRAQQRAGVFFHGPVNWWLLASVPVGAPSADHRSRGDGDEGDVAVAAFDEVLARRYGVDVVNNVQAYWRLAIMIIAISAATSWNQRL